MISAAIVASLRDSMTYSDPTVSTTLKAHPLLHHAHYDSNMDMDMDSNAYLALSNSLHRPHPNNTHSAHPQRHNVMYALDHWLHYPLGLANPVVDNETHNKAPPEATHEYFNIPPVDIRVTPTDYYFDLEVPGVTDKSSISVHWTSSYTFVVEGDTPRPHIATTTSQTAETDGNADFNSDMKPLVRCPISEEGDTEVKKRSHDESTSVTNGDLPPAPADQKDSSFKPAISQEPNLILGERMIGRYRRFFSIPCDHHADKRATEASLAAGVLTIKVPKLKPNEGKTEQHKVTVA